MLAQSYWTPSIIKGSPVNDNFLKQLARVLICVACCLPGLAIGILVRKTDSTNNAYFLTVFETGIPTLIMGFCFFFIGDILNKKIGLLKIVKMQNYQSVDSNDWKMHTD